jgi:hypothetical protein
MTPHTDVCLDPRPPAPLLPQSPVLSDARQVCHPRAAGIDSGAAAPWIAVPPGCAPQPVRRCGPVTADRDALAAWRMDGGVTTGAMASTGVSGMPVGALVEARGWPGLLRAPRHAPRAPGRPHTARRAGPWLPRGQTSGRRAGAGRPEAHGWVRRGALRHRQRRRTSAAHPRPPRPTA